MVLAIDDDEYVYERVYDMILPEFVIYVPQGISSIEIGTATISGRSYCVWYSIYSKRDMR